MAIDPKAPKTSYTQEEVDALLAKQARGDDSFEDTVKRPYHTIYGPAGTNGAEVRVASEPKDGGAWTVGGQHPDDYYGVTKDKDGKYVATKNCGDLPAG